ncbi:E3 ubiquitin ligase BIG BROTHER-related-like [Macadamia integrifolia]|uniref:E3 ubiquitin ligase BIG BROTHER-related-like n=1 Tax=Macadamia integrifolia TaxID=60698 RepID=UPI001C52D0ED|nr:E3 ubiquitin ligase BIG BROTHER-related-like [Macadamia integrifolia]
MAEVSDLHLFDSAEDDDGEVVDEVETLDFSSLPYWSNDFDHDDFYASDSDPFFPQLSEFVPSESDHSIDAPLLADDDNIHELQSCLQIADADGSDSDSVTNDVNYYNHEDQLNFVMDLFERRLEQSHVTDNSNGSASDPLSEAVINESSFGVPVARNREMNADFVELGLGLAIAAHGEEDENDGFMISECGGGEFFVGRRGSVSESGESSTVHATEPVVEGLRVVGIGSDSDEEEEGGLRIDVHSGHDDELDRAQDYLGLPLCWDCLRLEDQRDTNEDFEWEEVNERADEREVLSMVVDADEERSVSTDIRSEDEEEEESGEGGEESIRNLEWEVLLADNHLERNAELEHEIESYHDTESFLADEYIYTAEYEMIFGQFTETESALKGGPPASKSVVENLASIFLTQDDVKDCNVLCAVCKDEISTKEEAKRLPCSHHYHGDCIIPWLNIRNTCPVCRFELPTDDPDYEQRRIRRSGHRL